MISGTSQTPWSQSTNDILKEFQVNLQNGLSQEEAQIRQNKFGSNLLKIEKKESALHRFFNQFKSPVVIILLIATVISALLGELIDSIAILTIVIINAIIGFIQESRAEEAVEALKKLSAPKARVLRNGIVNEIQASKVTLGDILVLEAGDYIAADSRILQDHQLSTDEMALTGESLPVRKSSIVLNPKTLLSDRQNMLFAGTTISTGSARAVVSAIGMNTEIGKIASMLETAKIPPTPLQIRLEQVSNKLLVFCGIIVIIVAVLGVYHGERWLDVLMTAISLAVAAIPEGLPTVVTLALALAVHRMAKRNAIVRHLPAVETLGSTNVICSDKTGTLTTGKMRVREIFTLNTGIQTNIESRLIESGILCSNASLNINGSFTGDPTEVAILYFGQDHHINLDNLSFKYPRLFEWSFDSTRKRMSVAIKDQENIILHTKGAPESVLPLCQLSEIEKQKTYEALEELSSLGRRVLAVATKRLSSSMQEIDSIKSRDNSFVENNLQFLGLISIADPPRQESIRAINECKASGIKVVMITGDHPTTARAIAKELGIIEEGSFDQVLTGQELEQLSQEELEKQVEKIAVYARVTPEHKLRIIESWQKLGNIVAMTGDGVNDAPALKKASIGISMGKGGTEVARQASSIILTDDNFSTIVSAVEEGRAIYGNIRRTIQYLLSGNLAEILIMLGAAIMGWPTPLLPVHLLWINLVTDGLPSLALAAEPVPKNALSIIKKPSPQGFFDRHFYNEMIFVGFTTAILSLLVYAYSMKYEDEVTARTHAFSFLVFAELFRSFACRSENKTSLEMGLSSNIYHLISVIIPIIFQISLHHSIIFKDVFKVTTMEWTECLILIAITLIPVTLIEIRKWIQHQKINKSRPR